MTCGAQRRVEGRIGQLLGEPKMGSHHSVTTEGAKVDKDDRVDFRLLGRALSGDVSLTPDEWRRSRRALIATLRERLGLRPETPELPDGIYPWAP